MSLKVLGGVARSFSLAAPHNFKTRPTSVMLKRRLFDSVQDFTDTKFIDLCAGSGSIGIEALSRGASEVYFVENNKQAYSVLKTNLKNLRVKHAELGKVHTTSEDAIKWLKHHLDKLEGPENIYLFFDPPYEDQDLYRQFFKLVQNKMRGITVIVEACKQKTMKLDEFEREFGTPRKLFEQGTSFFAIYDQ